ncbi:hypothetical protein EVAR_36260_1 [Eumeta japonica]|uniref:Uncharacterized protein n=1 Tax=Eumeta variegata TaxID=151549 RepID=A0A4C1WZK1_EUMVA|nr:hypothetical protein EVAR_36260_1 [Eumeta japonica]
MGRVVGDSRGAIVSGNNIKMALSSRVFYFRALFALVAVKFRKDLSWGSFATQNLKRGNPQENQNERHSSQNQKSNWQWAGHIANITGCGRVIKSGVLEPEGTELADYNRRIDKYTFHLSQITRLVVNAESCHSNGDNNRERLLNRIVTVWVGV